MLREKNPTSLVFCLTRGSDGPRLTGDACAWKKEKLETSQVYPMTPKQVYRMTALNSNVLRFSNEKHMHFQKVERHLRLGEDQPNR